LVNKKRNNVLPEGNTLGSVLGIYRVDCIRQVDQFIDQSLSNARQADNDANPDDGDKQDIFNEDRPSPPLFYISNLLFELTKHVDNLVVKMGL
jgi:hypothetical protein